MKTVILSFVNILVKSHLLTSIGVARLKYFYKLHRWPDFEHPKDLNEKINWLKFYGDTSQWPMLADKFAVREYVRECGLEDCLIPLIGKWDSVDDIDWDALPQQFVMKCNNGSGDVVVCKDKDKLDIESTKRHFRKCLDEKLSVISGEPHYAKIKPCIIAEQLLDSSAQPSDSNSLVDYKIWCFNGKPAYIVCYSNRHDKYYSEIGVYDLNWSEHREFLKYSAHYKPEHTPMPKPKCLDRMIEIASTLSCGFPEVRVDLYEVNGNVFFGELTFTSSGGYMAHFTQEFLDKMGQLTIFGKRHDKRLAFIRFALAPTRFEAPEMSEQDWKMLYSLAYRQTILGVVWNGVERLEAQGIEPPHEVKVKWISKMVGIEKHNLRANITTAKLSQQLEQDGFRSCILKGQGNNLMYPNKYSRSSGDIDVWLTKSGNTSSDVKEIKKYVRRHNPKGRAIYHHIDYGFFEKIDVEVHYRPSFLNNPIHNHRLQKWFAQQAEAQFSNRVELPDNAGTIAVPTPEFNAVYQLAHIYNHVLNKGLSMRQIIDYYYVMLSIKDKQNLESTLRYLGLGKIAGAMMCVLHRMLGLEEKYLIMEMDEQLGRVLAREIMNGRNFKQLVKNYRDLKSGKTRPLWQLKLEQNLQRLQFDLRMVRYFPSECLCEPLFRIYHFFWRLFV